MIARKLQYYVFGLVLSGMLANVPLSALSEAASVSFSPIEIPDRFQGGIPPYAIPRGISPDGSRVVGNIATPGVVFDCPSFLGCTSSFSWEEETGTSVGNIAGFPTTIQTTFGERELFAATMVAASNEAVLAHADIPGKYIGPLLLTAGGPILLSEEQVSVGFLATAISNNGEVVIGREGNFNNSPGGFRWTADTGIQSFGTDSESSVFPSALSGDGRVIVGLIYNSPSPFLVSETASSSGFRWTESEGFVAIPNEPEERRFIPSAASNDGSLIVGRGVDENSRQLLTLDPTTPSTLLEPRALFWTEDTGTELLELPIRFLSSSVSDVSDNGRLIIGSAILESPLVVGEDLPTTDGSAVLFYKRKAAEVASSNRAVLWNEDRQAHDLQQWLVDNYNLSDQLEGWTLTSASAISANGQVIAGRGVNPDGNFQGWVVTIPEPCSLALAVFPLVLFFSGNVEGSIRNADPTKPSQR